VREERTNLFEKEREETQREDGYTTVLSTETDVSCVGTELHALPSCAVVDVRRTSTYDKSSPVDINDDD
jgi:hypothetical protein